MSDRWGGWRQWWAFGALCLVGGCRWITDQAWPGSASTVASEARACAFGALLAVLATLTEKAPPAWGRVLALAAAGAALLAGPVIGTLLHGVAADEYNRAVALCMVPVIVAVAATVRGSGGMAKLWPGLAGLAGALLIFPVNTSGSPLGFAWLILPVVAVGIACVTADGAAGKISLAWAVAALLGGGAAGLGLLQGVWLRGEQSPDLLASTFDLIVIGLMVLALLRVGALRFASSYFFIPLLTVVGGAVVMRPGWGVRLLLGLALLAIGGGAQVRTRGIEEGTPGLGLRG